ncbi:hypothetical protein ACQ4M3_05515 [Leptolyngbya sp. AN03gr2]|uniref:hypothetical protein n=1 Tax=unclassified Leptolyngbya TaxID=2650499 RepID=UPI003D312CC4
MNPAQAVEFNSFDLFSIAQAKNTTPASLFAPILDRLNQTGIPLRLPRQILASSSLYAVLWSASSNGYEVALTSEPRCRSNYCRNGLVSAKKLTADMPSIEQEFAFLNDPKFRPQARSPEPLSEVQLANGKQGFFIPWVLGANYSDAKVIWEENGYRYLVSWKKGDRNTLIQLANSAIQAANKR